MKKFCFLFLLCFLAIFANAQRKTHYKLLVGTYTNTGKSEGIYSYDFNASTASTELKSITRNINDPNYLAISPNQKFVYVVNQTDNIGALSSFKYVAQTGKLIFLNKVESEGAGPCFVTVDNKHVIVANYRSGSLAVFNRRADGSLTNAIQIIQHTGKSVDLKRQLSAHVHMVQFTPDHKYLVCNDLGEDLTYLYYYNTMGKERTLVLKSTVKSDLGTGPRHITFSPNGKFAYLVHEFNGSITAFVYAKGQLTKIQEISTTPQSFEGTTDGADIHISGDGKFLYETNRGDANSISTFSILPSGTLKFIETVSTLGEGPRNFTIDPDGNFLLVAHQYTNNVVIFNRNKKTGRLTDTGRRIEVGAPVCLVFAK